MSTIPINRRGFSKNQVLLFMSFVFLSFSLNQITTEHNFALIFPVMVMITLMLYLMNYLFRIEGRVPIFDVGFFMIGITFLYCFYPYLSFMLSGFDWSATSDNRLKSYNVGVVELGSFAWFHVSYLASLIVGYLLIRQKKTMQKMTKALVVKRSETMSAAFIYLFIMAFDTYYFLLGDADKPHFLLQIANMIASIKFVFTIYFMIFCFSHWHIKLWRILLFTFLGYELFLILAGEAGRTWFFLHFCSCLMLYDRLVKPFKVLQLISITVLGIIVFLALGFFRHGAGDALLSVYLFISGTNEFTSIMATAQDIYMRKEVLGTLYDIPWQVYFDDIIHSIPSQLLPFEKIDLSTWYLQVLDIYGQGVGLMFGVIAQGIVGGGIIELIIRGILTGAFFGWLHNHYLKHTDSYWVLVLYIFLGIKSYYIIRASTGYLLYFIIYNYLPALLAVKFLTQAGLNAKKEGLASKL